jgi:hypothetical protein
MGLEVVIMKNKEIEELLNELKDVAKRHTIEVREYGVVETIPSSISKELRLNSYSANLLLSYIEQLENNIDKAIEIINIEKSKMEYAKYDSCLLLIEQVLKGDSDDE